MAKAKEIIGLDCSAQAIEGAAKVLQTRLDEMVELQRTSADFTSVVLIHDLRVASRRLRSALRDFTPLLNKESFKEIKKDLKKMADALGKVRDEDVAIEALEKLQTEAEDETIKEPIGLLIEERKVLRESARLELTEVLTLEKLNLLREIFSTKLDEAVNSKEPDQTVSFKEFGQTVIGKNLQEFEELNSSLYQPSEIENLHQLRIMAKRLRYAMKVFAVCWDEEYEQFAKRIAKMQTFLGQTHDCDEWIENILWLLREEDETLDKNKREALIWLLSIFLTRRAQEYTSALKLWSDWQADYFMARLKALTL